LVHCDVNKMVRPLKISTPVVVLKTTLNLLNIASVVVLQ